MLSQRRKNKTIRYSTAIRAGLVTSSKPTIVRVIMRDKSKKLGDFKVPDKLHSVWKERGGERKKKGRGKKERKREDRAERVTDRREETKKAEIEGRKKSREDGERAQESERKEAGTERSEREDRVKEEN